MEIIVTARLTLRPVATVDLGTVHALWTDANVRRYLWDDVVIPREYAEELVRKMIAAGERNGRGLWLVYQSGRDAPSGFCGFLPRDAGGAAPELIYGLRADAWGKGYATEAARAVIEYGFEKLNLPKIVASTDVPNAPSIRVLDRLGMRFVRRDASSGLDLVFYEIENPNVRRVTAFPDTPRR